MVEDLVHFRHALHLQHELGDLASAQLHHTCGQQTWVEMEGSSSAEVVDSGHNRSAWQAILTKGSRLLATAQCYARTLFSGR